MVLFKAICDHQRSASVGENFVYTSELVVNKSKEWKWDESGVSDYPYYECEYEMRY